MVHMITLTINGKGAGEQRTGKFTGFQVARLGKSPRQYDLIEGAGAWGGYWVAAEVTYQPNREVAIFGCRADAEEHIHLSQLEEE